MELRIQYSQSCIDVQQQRQAFYVHENSTVVSSQCSRKSEALSLPIFRGNCCWPCTAVQKRLLPAVVPPVASLCIAVDKHRRISKVRKAGTEYLGYTWCTSCGSSRGKLIYPTDVFSAHNTEHQAPVR